MIFNWSHFLKNQRNRMSVSLRVRLPNGERLQRRFHHSSNMEEVTLWTQHECREHGQSYLIRHSQIISTMPRTVYDDMSATMQSLKFWRPRKGGKSLLKRKMVSPWLYVEEI